MSELGYYQQIEGGIFGQPDQPYTPEELWALQNGVTQEMILRASQLGAVPQSYQGNPQQGPSNQELGGPSNLPKVGWTCQNGTGSPFVTQPDDWTAEDMGRIPDWEANGIPSAGGQYDMNPVVGSMPVDRLNQAPIGEDYFDAMIPNPNCVPQDGGSLVGDSEY